MDNPIAISNIFNHQATDLPLQQKIMDAPNNYQREEMEGHKVIHVESSEEEAKWKIFIPSTLVPQQLLPWYHLGLGHCRQQIF